MDRDSPSPHCLPQASVNPEAVSARMGSRGPERVCTLPAKCPPAATLPPACLLGVDRLTCSGIQGACGERMNPEGLN